MSQASLGRIQMNDKIRVLLTDDHAIVRDGMKMLLNLKEDLFVSGEAGSLKEAMEAIPAVHPDIVLLDFRLPDGEWCHWLHSNQAVLSQY